MTLIFYPNEDVVERSSRSSIRDKIGILLDAAAKYKAYVLNQVNAKKALHFAKPVLQQSTFNWDFIVQVMRDIYDLPEEELAERQIKSDSLLKLSEVYSVLRSARMPKLENTRVALFQYAHKLINGL